MDLNHRPPGPEPGALARLRYAPTGQLRAKGSSQAELQISTATSLRLGGLRLALVLPHEFAGKNVVGGGGGEYAFQRTQEEKGGGERCHGNDGDGCLVQ
jgi:hypothetical protein